MGIVARHKKPGGFRKLIHSLETTPPEKRKKIIDIMQGEDQTFAKDVEASIFNFEEFLNVGNPIITELVETMSSDMKTIALALYHTPDPLLSKFLNNMLPRTRKAFDGETSELLQVKMFEQVSARFRMIAKARELEGHAKFSLKKMAGNYPE